MRQIPYEVKPRAAERFGRIVTVWDVLADGAILETHSHPAEAERRQLELARECAQRINQTIGTQDPKAPPLASIYAPVDWTVIEAAGDVVRFLGPTRVDKPPLQARVVGPSPVVFLNQRTQWFDVHIEGEAPMGVLRSPLVQDAGHALWSVILARMTEPE